MKSQSTTASVSLSQMSLSERETHGLKYIGGYIFHKLHKKLKNSKNWKSPVSQQAQSLLLAGKIDEGTEKESKSLLSKLNRGGLWNVRPRVKHMLLAA